MQIQKMLLDRNPYSRPGTKLGQVRAVACHYIGNPGSTAVNNRNYFNNLQHTKKTKASSHYIIGLRGEIIQCIPETEISYCTNSANSYTISIEACHPDSSGRFTDATYSAYVELCADLCRRHNLDPLNGGLIRHYDVTRKVCPKWFVDHPTEWDLFRRRVWEEMRSKKNGWIKEGAYWFLWQNGKKVIGDWYLYKGQWYFLNRHTGRMVANDWIEWKGKWYFLNPDGSMKTGWQEWKGKWYYLDANQGGAMAVNTVTPDGYRVGADGVWIK